MSDALPAMRDAVAADLPRIVALNDSEIPHVNALTEATWRRFISGEARVRVADARDGSLAALLVALPPGRDYGSENYAWFQRKLADFLYVDRIVVAAPMRGRGMGAAIYRDVAALTTAPVVCEVNLRPTNDASLAFHGKQGFREIGVQSVYGDTKRVSMLARRPDGTTEPSLPGPDDGAVLRRATAADAPSVVRLAEALLVELGGQTAIDVAAIAAMLATSQLIITLADDATGAAAGLAALTEGRAVYASGAFGVVTELYVAPALRSRGLGARLIAACRREAAWRGWHRLEVTTPDATRFASAQRFYARNGFSAIGPRLRLPLA